MQEWFPIYRSMLEDSEEFKKMTHTEKVFYLNLVADMNASMPDGGTFYRADTWYAAALNVTPRKIRDARVKFKKAGLIDYEKGGMKGNRPIATTYKYVRWSTPPEKGNGEQFAKFNRMTFDVFLHFLRAERLKIEDIVTFAYIKWWRNKFSQLETFVVFKSDFSRHSGVRKITDSISRLCSFQYSSGNHLFKYEDRHFKIVLWELNEPDSPNTNEVCASISAIIREEITEEAQSLSKKEKASWLKNIQGNDKPNDKKRSMEKR